MDGVGQWSNQKKRAAVVLLVTFGLTAALIHVFTSVEPSYNRRLRFESNIFKYLVSSPEEDTRLSFSTAGADKLDTDFRIVGGTAAPAGKYPFYVNTLRPILCGGTLIHPDIVLSAAHCEGGFLEGVSIGGLRLDGDDGVFLSVDQELLHPDYDEATRFNDIMLVKLSTVSAVDPIALNFDSSIPAQDQQVTVTGYGDTSDGGDVSDILLEVTVDTYSDVFCDTLYRDYEPSIMVCAGTEQGGRDSCQGDSGGPLFDTEISVQVGVVSTGSGCGEPNIPAIYTEVASYEAWIRAGICDLSSVPPSSCNTPGPTVAPIVATPTPTQAAISDPTTSAPAVSPTEAPARAPVTSAPITSSPTSSPTSVPTATPPTTPAPTKSPAPSGSPSISTAPSLSLAPSSSDVSRGVDDDDDDDDDSKKKSKKGKGDDDDDDGDDDDDDASMSEKGGKEKSESKGKKSKGMKGMKQKGMKGMKRNRPLDYNADNIVYARRHPWAKLGIGI